MRSEEISLPEEQPYSIHISYDPYTIDPNNSHAHPDLSIPGHKNPPNPPEKSSLDQVLPHIGLDSNEDIAAAFIASQVSRRTGLDIPISAFWKAKYLLSTTNSTDSIIEPHPI